jgi:D-galactarolactone isomerase
VAETARQSRPKLKAPPGACDTHIHIVGPLDRYPIPPEAAIKPGAWLLEAYLAMLDRIGVERAVVVQPSTYGADNACTLEAVRRMGPRARGVATVGTGVTDAELARLTEAGIRGARFHMLTGGVLPWDMLAPMAARVQAFGWHVQLQMDGRRLHEKADMLHGLPGTLVIDHTGKFLEPVGPDHPGFEALLGLVGTGRCWVKLSAPYETSKSGPPDYRDVGVLAKALIAAAPERMLWASNWPHFNEPEPAAKPDDAMLLDVLLHWTEDEATRNRILVDNPAELYGFD